MSTVTQTFKKTDETSVKIAMDLLIHANTKTTTKEVKDLLRTLGFHASQREVSQMMEDQYMNGGSYLRSQGPGYFEYTFSAFRSTAVGFAEECDEDGNSLTPSVTSISDPNQSTANTTSAQTDDATPVLNLSKDTSKGIADANSNFRSTFMGSSPAVDPSTKQAVVKQSVTDKVVPIASLYTPNHARAYVAPGDTWVLSSADNTEIQLFAGSNTRDHVRSSYAKSTGVKFVNVRACRLSNF